MSLNQKRVTLTIDSKGGYSIEAGEGFTGASCVEQTRDLEIAIGGSAVSEGKTDAYYEGDGDNPVNLNL
ncbi:hypothetical protein [Bacillus atrophaeus]|uniref:hypothetical protein n=1 Tax=Bacillus atrophaeus TaxID=1452 RepID=UPI002E1EB4BB|nr:hypothetical protein [Bacillus atrophaeus]